MVIRIGRWVVGFAAWLVGTLTILAAAFAWALAGGGLAFTAAVPHIERALTPADGRFEVHVGAARLRWSGWARAPNIRVEGVRVKGADGEAVTLPALTVAFSPRALLRGTLAPTRVGIEAPRLEIARYADGTVDLRGIGTGGPRTPEEERWVSELGRAALAALSASPDGRRGPFGHLERLRVAGGRVLFEDRASGLTLTFTDAALVVARSPTGLEGRLDLELEQAGDLPGTVHAVADYRPGSPTADDGDGGDGRMDLAIDVRGLRPAGLAALAPALPLDRLDLRLDGRFELAVDNGGDPSPVAFALGSGAGRIRPSDLLPDGLAIDAAWLQGSFDDELATLQLDEVALTAGGTTLRANAVVQWDEPPLEIWARAAVDRLPASELGRFWPAHLSPRAREWVLSHIEGGVARDATVALHLGPEDLAAGRLPADGLEGRFVLDGVTIRYFGALPPATGVAGEARFTADRLDIALTGGRVGRLRARGGTVALTGLAGEGTKRAVIEVDAAGPVPDALALIDHPPLGFAGKIGLDPASTAGEVEARLRFDVPLVRDLTPDKVAIRADAELEGAAVRGLIGGADLSDGDLRLRVDNAGLDVTGEAALAGVPVALTWRENFAPGEEEPKRRYGAAGRLDDDDLRRLGAGLDGLVAGELGVEAVVTERRDGGGRRAEVAIDLEDAAVTVPQLAWRKPEGVPARLGLTAVPADDGTVALEDLVLAASDLQAMGRGLLAGDPLRPVALDLARYAHAGTSGAVRWEALEHGGRALDLDLAALDLRPLLALDGGADDGNGRAPMTPLDVRLNAERLLLPGGALTGVRGTLSRDAAGWRSADLTGRLPGGSEVTLKLEPAEPSDGAAPADGGAAAGHRQLTVRADDAGALLRVVGATSAVQGGTFKLDAAIEAQVPRPVGAGKLRLDDFMVTEAPPLARLLTLASMTGIANLLAGRGIEFERLRAPFRFDGGDIAITDAQMSGSQVGLTADGSIGLGNGGGELDLSGTVVPLYGLNRALGQVPLIGALLAGGGGDEGIFAATYRVRGTRNDSEFTVNPLAALAPGIVRKLVQGIIEGTHEPPVMDNNLHDDK